MLLIYIKDRALLNNLPRATPPGLFLYLHPSNSTHFALRVCTQLP